MSQDDVLDVLRELGGRATTLEVRAECRRRWPDRTLDQYAHSRLRQLVRWGLVRRESRGRLAVWVLTTQRATPRAKTR